MKFLSELIKYFCYITTGIVLVSGLSALGNESIPSIMVLQTAIAGAVTALVTTAMLYGEPKSKKDMVIRLSLHYVVLCLVMIAIGFWFRWISRDFMGAMFMVLSVAVVYLFTGVSYWVTSKKEVDELNRALQEKYKDTDKN